MDFSNLLDGFVKNETWISLREEITNKYGNTPLGVGPLGPHPPMALFPSIYLPYFFFCN